MDGGSRVGILCFLRLTRPSVQYIGALMSLSIGSLVLLSRNIFQIDSISNSFVLYSLVSVGYRC